MAIQARCSSIVVRQLDDPQEILRARRMHGARYLEEGYVETLDEHGLVSDEYVPYSTYFAATSAEHDELLGTLRVIHGREARFPALDHLHIDEEWRARLDGVPTERIGETSALVTVNQASLMFATSTALARASFQYHVQQDFWYALIIVEHSLLRVLNRIVGLPFVQIGPVQDYLGPTFPALLDLRNFVIDLRDHDTPQGSYLREGLDLREQTQR